MNFASAMQEASDVLAELDQSVRSGQTADFNAKRLQEFLGSEESARGFFVALLTGDFHSCDNPPSILLEALASAPDAALTVLVKNLVMSSATEVVHNKNNDVHNAAGSRRVIERTRRLMTGINTPGLRTRLQAMQDSLENGGQSFAPFLARVNYSQDQKMVALEAVRSILCELS